LLYRSVHALEELINCLTLTEIIRRFFLKRGWDKALSDGGAVGQAHKRIALLRFACL
jgi:hypothetical protein